MIVLGISGLPNAQRFHEQRFPGVGELDNRICQGLDSAAALVVDGTVVAAASEERFNGKKGCSDFPARAIRYCLNEAGVSLDDVDVVAHGFDYKKYRNIYRRSDEAYYDQVLAPENVLAAFESEFSTDVSDKFRPVLHHRTHAASAHFVSGMDRSVCIVSDGMGELEAISIFTADGNTLKAAKKYPIQHSLGLVYSLITRFLGFTFNLDEYKVMGLAAYGDPKPYAPFFRDLIEFDATTEELRVQWPEGVLESGGTLYSGGLKILAEQLDLDVRAKDDEIRAEHKNLAAAAQQRLEEVLVDIVRHWTSKLECRNVCLAGGTFLNCKANHAITKHVELDALFAQPASGDDGSALGAALHEYYRLTPDAKRPTTRFDAYLGPGFDAESVEAALNESDGLQWEHLGYTEAFFAAAADDIASDKIVAWFSGRMEFGPRALGNRSILGLPSGDNIKERINRTVKFREPFRPFAPSVMEEDAQALFDYRDNDAVYYMLCTADVRPEAKNALSGITHADDTARIQVVTPETNAPYHQLLSAVKERTGHGCVVNTSFNVKGQPLIRDPHTAIDTFRAINLDALYIEGFRVWKKPA